MLPKPLRAAAALWLFAALLPGLAQARTTNLLDEAVAPGANYAKAAFRLWLPPDSGPLQGTLVLVPGSNGDGRDQVEDPAWQSFARRHHLALVGCQFTDKVPSIVEAYANVSQGSGQALLSAISSFAARSHHGELARAPLVLWGMSAGGEFNYEFAAWKPKRVAAFVVNKGNFYYTGVVSPETRAVPALLFVGTGDLAYRVDAVTGLFAMNRRAGALWALVREPGVPHAVGRSDELSRIFFDDVLPMRLGAQPTAALRALDGKKGFLGDLAGGKTIAPADAGAEPKTPTAWLPTERVARAWLAVETGTPFGH
jgi:dienelactone hydrolase